MLCCYSDLFALWNFRELCSYFSRIVSRRGRRRNSSNCLQQGPTLPGQGRPEDPGRHLGSQDTMRGKRKNHLKRTICPWYPYQTLSSCPCSTVALYRTVSMMLWHSEAGYNDSTNPYKCDQIMCDVLQYLPSKY